MPQPLPVPSLSLLPVPPLPFSTLLLCPSSLHSPPLLASAGAGVVVTGARSRSLAPWWVRRPVSQHSDKSLSSSHADSVCSAASVTLGALCVVSLYRSMCPHANQWVLHTCCVPVQVNGCCIPAHVYGCYIPTSQRALRTFSTYTGPLSQREMCQIGRHRVTHPV